MPFIDSHCHLDFEVLSSRLDAVVKAANAQGVTNFVVPSIRLANLDKVLHLSEQYPQIYYAFGFHPCFMNEHKLEHVEVLRQYCLEYAPCAIGEIGLDFFIEKDRAARSTQLQLFEAQLLLAREQNLPVILHVRKAHDQVLKMLKALKFESGGIIHAFNGSHEQAIRYTQEFAFKLGFGGAITHTRATKLRGLVKLLALEDLVLETDAPDMPLANMPQSYNQPANIRAIAQVIFELRDEDPAQIERQLEHNTRSCLNFPYA